MIQINLKSHIDNFFNEKSVPDDSKPKCVIITGGVGSGKTTIRKKSFSEDYVVIDANEIYRNLNKETGKDFDQLQDFINSIGQSIAKRAVDERRNISVEIIGDSSDKTTAIVDAFTRNNYEVKVNFVHCDLVESRRRHLKAVEEDPLYISCYFTQDMHINWILQAFKK